MPVGLRRRTTIVPAVPDWDPNDPEAVKVHYDVSTWSLDQRAELSAALAEAEVEHLWDGDELVVPEHAEGEVDAIFERLEELLGPFATPLDPDDAGVEYGLDEWPAADRRTLGLALIERAVPHRWDRTTVVVATDREAEVDELLDAVEQGTVVLEAGTAGGEPPDGALSTMFSAGDRLARDPDDRMGSDELRELTPQLDRKLPPYGLDVPTWAGAVDAAQNLLALVDDDKASSSDVIGAAQHLRSLVRGLV